MSLRFFVLAAVSSALLVPLICSAESSAAKQFDCLDMFDVLASLAAPACLSEQPVDRAPEITAAIDLLVKHRFVSRAQFRTIEVAFCPLNFGLGLVPKSNTIFIDDGLRHGSIDTLAEILMHELEHVNQIHTMGVTNFKCGYINALVDCGGCYDENHPLEAPAYATQARVRDFLLLQWKRQFSSETPPLTTK